MIRRLFARPSPQPAVPPGERLYAIGDVHGRDDLLADLLDRLRDDHGRSAPAQATVIFVGDLIDRGPDSAAVVERAMTPLDWARTIAIKGNHEAALLGVLDGDRTMVPIWLNNGGDAALRSWGVGDDVLAQGTIADLIAATQTAIPSHVRMWLARMRQSVHIGDYYFVHAGVRPGVALDKQSAQDSMWIRAEFLDSRRGHGAVIVHGHSITETVEQHPNRIGIDTGAYASGRLTALVLEGMERRIVQT